MTSVDPTARSEAKLHRYILASFLIVVLAIWGKYCSWSTIASAYITGPALAQKTCKQPAEKFHVRFDRAARDTFIEFQCPRSTIQHEGLFDHGDANWLD